MLIFQVWKRKTEDILLQSRVDWISEAIQRNKAIKEANIKSINDYFISKWNSIFLVINKTTDEFKSPWRWLKTTHFKFFVVDFFSFFLNIKIQPNWFLESLLKAWNLASWNALRGSRTAYDAATCIEIQIQVQQSTLRMRTVRTLCIICN